MILFSSLIKTEYNHHSNSINLPASIEKRLSNNSFNEQIFKELAIYDQDTLNKHCVKKVCVEKHRPE